MIIGDVGQLDKPRSQLFCKNRALFFLVPCEAVEYIYFPLFLFCCVFVYDFQHDGHKQGYENTFDRGLFFPVLVIICTD